MLPCGAFIPKKKDMLLIEWAKRMKISLRLLSFVYKEKLFTHIDYWHIQTDDTSQHQIDIKMLTECFAV